MGGIEEAAKPSDEEKATLRNQGSKSGEKESKAAIDIHWNHQSSFPCIKTMILALLVTELITSLGMVIFAYTNPGDTMLDITMGSFVVVTIIFLIAIYPQDNSWMYVIHGNKISLTFLIALRSVTMFTAILILIKTMMSIMASVWFAFQAIYLALAVTLICYPRTQVGNLVLKS